MRSFLDWKFHRNETIRADHMLNLDQEIDFDDVAYLETNIQSVKLTSFWIMSKRMRHQEVFCEYLGFGNTTSVTEIDRKTSHESVRL